MQDLATQFRNARRCSVPVLTVRTPDPEATKNEILRSLNGEGNKIPIFRWDLLHGLLPLNGPGEQAAARFMPQGKKPEMVTGRPTDMLMIAEKLPEDSILFMSNAHRFWSDPGVMQGIWNLRDVFKPLGNMFIATTTVGATIPSELKDDMLVIDEPLPDVRQLEQILTKTYEAINIAVPDRKTIDKAIDAVIGLAAFPAEQAVSMCLTKKSGLDLDGLWERKRKIIELNRGLTIWRGGEVFDAVGGLGNVKQFNMQVINGKVPFRVVMFIDEIDKALAGFGTDTSGVKTDMVGTLLTWMQDNEVDGELFLGPPGSGKTNIAKAIGNQAGVPTMQFDFSGMQSSLVGTSGEFLRNGLKVAEAMSQSRVLVIATCNSMANIPTALLRRFKLGKFFFDLPTEDERESIWTIYTERYGLDNIKGAYKDGYPEDDGWTGAEIKECCYKSWRLNLPLKESARYIVPIARSSADEIKLLRQQASGNLISASAEGYYEYKETATPARPSRKMRDAVTRVVDMSKVGEA